ncbi:hypothetical protein TTRE_0000320601 [Trichuris trichiura]|uniref:Uncharacterized protein n=1 Tax=Trichuris trichiura TaxID=36087 RepID=A0A077Z4D0_TRITR|nr:hypothetical protein TTRE_0000320601 [Trichuris trichiura]
MDSEEELRTSIHRILETDKEEFKARLQQLESKYLEIEGTYDLHPQLEITDEDRMDLVWYTKKLMGHIKDTFASVATQMNTLKIMEKMFDNAIEAAKENEKN